MRNRSPCRTGRLSNLGRKIGCWIQPWHINATPRCFRVYITNTRATKISNTVVYKHQYITNPTLSPESHVVAAAQQLATALQGNIPAGNKTAEALKNVSNLFTKIVTAKNETAKAKAQRNGVQATPAARQTTHLPRVEEPLQKLADP